MAAADDTGRRYHQQHLLHVQETAFSSRLNNSKGRNPLGELVGN